ncbi:MAG: T9SS type A sorting domain-containing protein [Bacteroidota bacterium]
MKKTALLIVFITAAFAGKGQNLVPNGDFEQYSTCPAAEGQIDLAAPWTNPVIWSGGGIQADYDNKCATSTSIDVPNNNFGYQPAHSGDGYSGIFLYSINWANLREYIQTTLSSPLVAGTCYHFEMYAALGDRCMFTTDDIEVYISDTLMNGVTDYFPLPVTPQISNPGIFPDSSSWTLLSGNYTATGGENYIIIGNFKYDVVTTFNNVNSTGFNESYVYIDDVSLTQCTAIGEQNENIAINIYPNPAKDELYIKSNSLSGKAEIRITDILGKEILRKQSNLQSSILNIQSLTAGIYFIEITNGKNIHRKKFIKE